ncbi:MAG: hypothetical protein HC773_32530 [Scytonema sp. CRU_2_7]|nr:hypothetical protein [Scytonema sp. CRU_2_7]
MVVCGSPGAGNTGRVVAPLHQRAIMGWNYGFRPHPADSEPSSLSLGRYAAQV